MSLSLLLHCKSLTATRDYYRDELGFRVNPSPGDTVTAILNGSSLIFTASDLWQGAGAGSFTVYIGVTDIDRYFDTVKNRLELAWPLQDMAYGSREFAVRDCNGYQIAFQAQPRNLIRGANNPLVVDVCNIAGSTFSDVNLENASFQDVNLRMSRFRDINFSGTHITDANLANAAVADSNMKGMTINGVLVSELIRAYEG
jgi:catechol 2,3-dioxygenase-like lactoylglutathione lyase family enzyme